MGGGRNKSATKMQKGPGVLSECSSFIIRQRMIRRPPSEKDVTCRVRKEEAMVLSAPSWLQNAWNAVSAATAVELKGDGPGCVLSGMEALVLWRAFQNAMQ